MKTYINIIINCLCIIPFAGILCCVFVIDNSLVNGVVSGKYFWFYAMIALASLGVFILYAVNLKSVKYRLADLLIILITISGVAVTYLNNGTLNNTKLILLILSSVLYFYFRILISQYKPALYILMICLIFTGFIEAVWGLRQLYGFIPSQHGLFKTTGSFFNPGPYAGYLTVILPITLHYILKDWKVLHLKLQKNTIFFFCRWIISLSTALSIILVLPATMSRASWLAAFTGCLFVMALYVIQQKRKKQIIINYIKTNSKKIITISIAFTLLIVLLLGKIYYLKKDSADGRQLIWKNSIELIKQNPLGVGIGNFAGSYGTQQAAYFASGQATEHEKLIAGNPEYAFNEFIQTCAEFGIIPSMLITLLLFYTIIAGVQKQRTGVAGGLVSLLVFALLSYPFSVLPFVIVLVFLLAACTSSEHANTQYQYLQNVNNHPFRTRLSIIAVLSLCAIITIMCIHNRYPTYHAYKYWNKARTLYTIKAYEEASSIYEKLFPYLKDQTPFLFEYGQCFSKTGKHEESNAILQHSLKLSCDTMIYNIIGKNYQMMKQYGHAEQYFTKAANIVPHRLYPYYLLSKLFLETGNTDKAIYMARQVLSKEAKVDSPAVHEMKNEMKEILKNK